MPAEHEQHPRSRTRAAEEEPAEAEAEKGTAVATQEAPPVPELQVGSLTDWRAWVAQQGGNQPGQTPPFMFPGVGPITDLVNPATSLPIYSNDGSGHYTPIPIKPADPWEGWTAQIPLAMAPTQPAGPVLISDTVPNTGPAAGGTVVVLYGQGFTGATAVNFGATAGTAFAVNSDTQITVTTPTTGLTAHTTYNVTVVSPLGNQTLYQGFFVP